MHATGGRAGVLRRWPLAGGWLSERDLPAPERAGTYLGGLRGEKRRPGAPSGDPRRTAGGAVP